jgi:dTDP-D-glucose 4,6-dehydratase
MNIIVTGGAGFIRSSLIKYLVKNRNIFGTYNLLEVYRVYWSFLKLNKKDITKILNELNCIPEETFETGIKKL